MDTGSQELCEAESVWQAVGVCEEVQVGVQAGGDVWTLPEAEERGGGRARQGQPDLSAGAHLEPWKRQVGRDCEEGPRPQSQVI